jgi:hypothetical protein
MGGMAAGVGVTVKDVGTPPSVPSVAVPAETVTVTVPVPAATVGLAGVPGTAMTVATGDPGEKPAVLVALVRRFFFTAATRNEYAPAVRPEAVQVRAVDDFVAPRAHPVPAPVHAPPVPVVTSTSYPTTDCVRVDSLLLSHDTTTWPTPATAVTDDDASAAFGVEDTDAEALGEDVADAEADALVVSDELGVELADAEADALGVALAVSDPDALAVADGSAASPRMTGAAASAALPPHPARSITAHAMTAPAAFAVFEPGSNVPKRPLRALMWGRASPGLCPITVHEASGYGLAVPRHHRVSTVLAPRRNTHCRSGLT